MHMIELMLQLIFAKITLILVKYNSQNQVLLFSFKYLSKKFLNYFDSEAKIHNKIFSFNL